jgi:prophage regulatory protein
MRNTSSATNVASLPAAVRAAVPAKAAIVQQRILRMRELTHYINRSRAAIYADIAAGAFPPPDVHLGPNAKGWRRETVDSWIASRVITH